MYKSVPFCLSRLALARTDGDPIAAMGYIESFPAAGQDTKRGALQVIKAAVGGTEAATVTSGAASDFLADVRELSVVGRLPLRRVPVMVPTLISAGATAAWIGEGLARKMFAGSYVLDPGLRLKSVGSITVQTREAFNAPTWDALQSLTVDMLGACAAAVDVAFLDPSNAGSDSTPAAVSNGVTGIAVGTWSIANLDIALRTAVSQVAVASNLLQCYWVMPATLAAGLALLRGTGGGPAYPGLGALGGTLAGLPVLTSGSAPASTIILVDPTQVSYADDVPTTSTTDQALIELDTAPTGDATTPAAASETLVALWQTDCIGIKTIMPAAWKKRRSAAVQVVTGVTIS